MHYDEQLPQGKCNSSLEVVIFGGLMFPALILIK